MTFPPFLKKVLFLQLSFKTANQETDIGLADINCIIVEDYNHKNNGAFYRNTMYYSSIRIMLGFCCFYKIWKQDLVFSVKLHLLGLIHYPLSLDHWLLTLDPWPLTHIPYPLTLIATPCSLSLNPQYCYFQENLGGRFPFFIHWRLSSIEGILPLNVVFHQRSSFIKGHLISKVVCHQKLTNSTFYIVIICLEMDRKSI